MELVAEPRRQRYRLIFHASCRLGIWFQNELERIVVGMGHIVILDADSNVHVEADGEGIVRVKLGSEPYDITLVGDARELHSVIIEADRQLSRLVTRLPGR